MTTVESLNDVNKQIYSKLLQRGWAAQDILIEVAISVGDRLIQPDFVLLYNLYPLAIIEVNSASNSSSDMGYGEQAIDYADILGLPFAFIATTEQFVNARVSDRMRLQNVEIPTPEQLWQHIMDPGI